MRRSASLRTIRRARSPRRGLDKLLVIGEHEAYCQPCVSPIWDTALTCHALIEAGGEAMPQAKQGLDWLKPKQVLDVKGDWAAKRPDVRPGGWAFQYNNAYYPDLDDTAVVVMAMDRSRRETGSSDYDEAIARGREWIEGMQSSDGGWAAFDVDNLEYYLNNIPFSDHGALLDPPTEDVTARCISMLAQLGETVATSKTVADGVAYLRRTQLAEGSWYGRWGLNYVYGTWSVLSALNAASVDHQNPMICKAPQVDAKAGYQRLDEPMNFVFPASMMQIPAQSIAVPGGSALVTIPANAFGPEFPPSNVQLPVAFPGQTVNTSSQVFPIPEQSVKVLDRDLVSGAMTMNWLLFDGGMRKGWKQHGGCRRGCHAGGSAADGPRDCRYRQALLLGRGAGAAADSGGRIRSSAWK